MPLVTVAELKATLNIGNLYADAVLEQVIGTAENIILSMLVRKQVKAIEGTDRNLRELTFVVTEASPWKVGETIRLRDFTIAGLNGLTATVTEVSETLEHLVRDRLTVAEDRYTIRVEFAVNALTAAETVYLPQGTIIDQVSEAYYDTVPEAREAALAIAVDVFQSRVAPGGQMQGIDFTPGPYRLGRSLFTRVSGLLGRWVDTGSLIG
jgi:hypothetical protein